MADKMATILVGYGTHKAAEKAFHESCGESATEIIAIPSFHLEEFLNGQRMASLVESRPPDIKDAILAAAQETNRNPTPAQKESGIYKKGRFRWNGLQVVIENPKGSVRSGIDADGNEWEQGMDLHYGYISRSEGADGDHVDVFVGPDPESELVFVVDQVKPDGSFDEHKCLIGFLAKQDAIDGYLSGYEDGWQGLGEITAMTLDQFKQWIEGDTSRPVGLRESAAPLDRKRLLESAMELVWGTGEAYP